MTLDYNNPSHNDAAARKSWRRTVAWCVGAFVLLILGISCLLPSLGRARETAHRIKCASNLRQIGLAAQLYAREFGGTFPPDLITLYKHAGMPESAFTCPSANFAEAKGATQAQIVDAMLDGDHLGYVWTGGGLTTSAASDVVLAFDLEMHVPQDSATTTGMNVLFADGTANFVSETDAKKIWAQFISGIRPIRMPASPTTAVSSPEPQTTAN